MSTRLPDASGRARLQVGILISGRGSNMEALVRAANAPSYPAAICVVIANEPAAAGLDAARRLGIPALAVDHRPYKGDRCGHEQAIDRALHAHGVEVVCLAGYMRLLTHWLVERWRGRMLNIHPSLLPELPGLHTHARALAAGFMQHGCSVHLVTDGMDEGPVIARAEVPILHGDDEARLAARVLQAEHLLYPRALEEFAREARWEVRRSTS